ncbi:MAG: hypothetical protein NUV63_06850 [Gallionella sp.]|nr:hypothetical protein [Gallionella sp.]
MVVPFFSPLLLKTAAGRIFYVTEMTENLGDFPAGIFYLAACADADRVVVELDESNSCSHNGINGRQSIIVPIETPNHPPNCNLATAGVATLWPPNHQLVNVAVSGVTDPESDPVTISITGITQDEQVNGLGDGGTSPDGFGTGTSQAILRAERSGRHW